MKITLLTCREKNDYLFKNSCVIPELFASGFCSGINGLQLASLCYQVAGSNLLLQTLLLLLFCNMLIHDFEFLLPVNIDFAA